MTLRAEMAAFLRLAGPIIFANFVFSTFDLENVVLLGRLGSEHLAGAAVGAGVSMLVGAIAGGMGAAIEPVVAQAHGAGNWTRVNEALVKGALAGLMLCTPSTLLVLLAARKLEAAGVPRETATFAWSYMVAQLPSSLMQPMFVSVQCSLAGIQAPGRLVRVVIVGNIVHLVTGILFIHGDGALTAMHLPPLGLPSLGVVGAGIANDVSTLVLVLGGLREFRRARAEQMLVPLAPREPAAPSASIPPPQGPLSVRPLLLMATPVALVIAGEMGATVLNTLFAGRLGTDEMSAFRVLSLAPETANTIAIGISAAATTRVGWNIGRGDRPTRAALSALSITAGTLALGGTLVGLAPRMIPSLVTHDEGVIAIAAPLMIFAALQMWLVGVGGAASGSLRGAGDFNAPSGLHLLGSWLIGVPLSYVLAFRLGGGVRGLWIGGLTGLAFTVTALVLRLRVVMKRPIKRL